MDRLGALPDPVPPGIAKSGTPKGGHALATPSEVPPRIVVARRSTLYARSRSTSSPPFSSGWKTSLSSEG